MSNFTTSPAPISIEAVIEAGIRFTETLCPLVVVRPGLKAPVPNPTRRQEDEQIHVIIDPGDVASTVSRLSTPSAPVNLGIWTHPKHASMIVVVDIDGLTPATQKLLGDLGLSSRDDAWIQQTGRGAGHYQAVYFYNGEPLPRRIKAGASQLDLLSNGDAIVAPSTTHLWKDATGKRGGPYTWFPGHSPADIPFAELEPLSELAVEWWLEQGRPANRGREMGDGARRHVLDILLAPIEVGQRNDTLTKIGGWLRSKGAAADHVETFLGLVNQAQRDPLPAKEIEGIARSVGRYRPGPRSHTQRRRHTSPVPPLDTLMDKDGGHETS